MAPSSPDRIAVTSAKSDVIALLSALATPDSSSF
jgi:hypothetical protein